MSDWDTRFLGRNDTPGLSPDEVEAEMVAYMEREAVEDGTPWSAIARHMLGLHYGRRGARLWRQVWSDHKLKPLPPRQVWEQARSHLQVPADMPEPA